VAQETLVRRVVPLVVSLIIVVGFIALLLTQLGLGNLGRAVAANLPTSGNPAPKPCDIKPGAQCFAPP
jgi:hypothetical protein